VTENLSATGVTPGTNAAIVEPEEPIRIEMDKRVDLVISLVVAAVGVVIIYLTNQFRVGSFPDPVTSRGLSYFTGTYLILAGLVLAARRIWTWSLIPGNYTVSEGHEDEPGHPASAARSFTIFGICAAWAVLLKPLGFLIVTPLCLAAVLWLMNVRSPRQIAAFALGFTFVLWLAFSVILGLVLPYGILTGLARSWHLIY
jgi:putative tricarboxylic transport membrane protein